MNHTPKEYRELCEALLQRLLQAAQLLTAGQFDKAAVEMTGANGLLDLPPVELGGSPDWNGARHQILCALGRISVAEDITHREGQFSESWFLHELEPVQTNLSIASRYMWIGDADLAARKAARR